MNKLLLMSINDAIDKIYFKRKSYYDKAKELCQVIFNQFVYDNDGINFRKEKPFSTNFLKTIIKRDDDRNTILKELKNAGILISDESYYTGDDKTKAFCKSYKFHPALIYGPQILFTHFKYINKLGDRTKHKKMMANLNQISIKKSVYNYIPKLVQEQLNTIEFGSKINDRMITMKIGKKNIYKPKAYFQAIATSLNVTLIKFKKRFYIESVRSFIERKRVELEILYNYTLKRIEDRDFYADRNKTNNRLDHNLTALKKELFEYILLSGHKTVEIDIKNAQFALLANIQDFELDEEFKTAAQNGTLYELISSKIGLKKESAKEYLMITAFGKAEHHPVALNEIFPVTMNSINRFKEQNGYQNFSIMLQKAESNLMIDGVFNLLTKMKIPAIPVHDSMRVRVSDYDKAMKLINKFFKEKDIHCTLKTK